MSMPGRWIVGVALAMLIVADPIGAQRNRPLAPLPSEGLRVAPFFDGWYENPDGTITLSFGYSNLNRQEIVEIPIGPDNNIQPAEYDGRQPTSFPPARTETGRRDRERGVFTITVPVGFQGEVVWTLRNRGQTYRVPGRSKAGAYQLTWPMAMGSVPPLLRFASSGKSGRGPMGVQGDPVHASAGTPVSLSVWVEDDGVREAETVPVKPRDGRPPAAMNVTWYKYSGPGFVEFSTPKQAVAEIEGTATTSATFTEPGEYVIRARVDNFDRIDSSPGDQCCWTNGYLKVFVKP
jgi:hypothetical protein